MAGALTRQQKFQKVKKLTSDTVRSSAMTIASHGLDPDKFADVITEALLLNPDLLDCTETSLAKALRQCCQDGLIPNGREAAITTFRERQSGSSQATYMPMKEGLSRVAWETLGMEIHSGVVYDGDRVVVKRGAGVMQMIEVESDPFRTDRGEVMGAYAWAKLPMENYPRLVTMNRDDIEKRRLQSFAREKGPWSKWYAEMAKKCAIKSLIGDVRHLFSSNAKSARLLTMIEVDDMDDRTPALPEQAGPTIVEAEARPVPEPVPQPVPEPTPAPVPEPVPAQAAAQPSQTAGVDDIPETPPANDGQRSFLPPREGAAAPAAGDDPTAL